MLWLVQDIQMLWYDWRKIHTLMRQSDWCEIQILMQRSDWCEIHTLIRQSYWYVQYTTLHANIELFFFVKKELRKERTKNLFLRVLPNLSEGIFLVICLSRHQKQPQNQWNTDGEVANKLRDICSHEALDFTVRNSKKNYISHGIKTSPTRPTRHLKIKNKDLGSNSWYSSSITVITEKIVQWHV